MIGKGDGRPVAINFAENRESMGKFAIGGRQIHHNSPWSLRATIL